MENMQYQWLEEGEKAAPAAEGGDSITRREFLHGATIGAAAAAALLSTPHTSTMAGTTDKREKDIDAMLKAEREHPFHNDPAKWLEEHEKEFAECFDLSSDTVHTVEIYCMDERIMMVVTTRAGVRVLRLAGSGILRDSKEWIGDLIAYIQGIQPQGGQPITVKIFSHETCGAAALKNPHVSNPDACACDLHREMEVKLQAEGVRAEYAGNARMNGLHDHNALGVVIDLSGRMQRSPFNSFVINAPDWKKMVEDALLALEKVSLGGHSYGDKLPLYTFLVVEGDDPREADEAIAMLREKTAKHQQHIDIRIVRKKASFIPTPPPRPRARRVPR